MTNGGYLIIDLKGLPRTSGEPSALVGISNIVKNPYKRATLISGLVVADIEYPDFFAPFITSEGNHTASVLIGDKAVSISIDGDDNVTVTVAQG